MNWINANYDCIDFYSLVANSVLQVRKEIILQVLWFDWYIPTFDLATCKTKSSEH